ncbi:hypothetical protein [Streptomyces galilaeus]|uniref:hypothetical protein n=1 Tax=Streptomyces galilaeus TaxID=33899 RepID=UPI0016786CCE|nr:hypothetical protein [Streptomyces galilaeus]GGW85992.1 hypothetical protein GCM10010350_83120 [Streptomyces galilaeus]
MAHQFADPLALGEVQVRASSAVERALAPRGFDAFMFLLGALITLLVDVRDSCLDQASRDWVLVAEDGGRASSLGDPVDGEPSSFAPELADRLLELGEFGAGLTIAAHLGLRYVARTFRRRLARSLPQPTSFEVRDGDALPTAAA